MSEEWAGQTLVRAAQDGDVESLTVLVQGAYPHVQRFARTLCASPQDAEDAAQEALIILYRKVGTVRSTAAVTSWLFRIIRNECLRRARARHLLAGPPAAMPSAEDVVLDRLEAERVAAAIGQLPDAQRRVLVMRDIQGLPGRAVADALGLSLPAMKSQLHRARRALAQELHP